MGIKWLDEEPSVASNIRWLDDPPKAGKAPAAPQTPALPEQAPAPKRIGQKLPWAPSDRGGIVTERNEDGSISFKRIGKEPEPALPEIKLRKKLSEEPNAIRFYRKGHAIGELGVRWANDLKDPQTGKVGAWVHATPEMIAREKAINRANAPKVDSLPLPTITTPVVTGLMDVGGVASRILEPAGLEQEGLADAINQQTDSLESAADEASGKSWAKRMVRGAGRSVTSMAAGAAIGGVPGAIGMGAGSSASQAYTEAKNAGATDFDAKNYALNAGLIEGGISSLFQAVGLPGAEGIVANGIGGKAVKQVLGKLGKAVVQQELPEELLATAAENVSRRFHGVNPPPDKNPDGSYYSDEHGFSPLIQTYLDTVAQTALMVGAAGSPSLARAYRGNETHDGQAPQGDSPQVQSGPTESPPTAPPPLLPREADVKDSLTTRPQLPPPLPPRVGPPELPPNRPVEYAPTKPVPQIPVEPKPDRPATQEEFDKANIPMSGGGPESGTLPQADSVPEQGAIPPPESPPPKKRLGKKAEQKVDTSAEVPAQPEVQKPSTSEQVAVNQSEPKPEYKPKKGDVVTFIDKNGEVQHGTAIPWGNTTHVTRHVGKGMNRREIQEFVNNSKIRPYEGPEFKPGDKVYTGWGGGLDQAGVVEEKLPNGRYAIVGGSGRGMTAAPYEMELIEPEKQSESPSLGLDDELKDVESKISRMSRSIPVGQLRPESPEWDALNDRANSLRKQIGERDRPAREARAAQEAAEREAKMHKEMAEDAKRVAALPVFQRRNGWEIVKDGVKYVVRDPHTRQEVYSGNTLKRARQVADESAPDKPQAGDENNGQDAPPVSPLPAQDASEAKPEVQTNATDKRDSQATQAEVPSPKQEAGGPEAEVGDYDQLVLELRKKIADETALHDSNAAELRRNKAAALGSKGVGKKKRIADVDAAWEAEKQRHDTVVAENSSEIRRLQDHPEARRRSKEAAEKSREIQKERDAQLADQAEKSESADWDRIQKEGGAEKVLADLNSRLRKKQGEVKRMSEKNKIGGQSNVDRIQRDIDYVESLAKKFQYASKPSNSNQEIPDSTDLGKQSGLPGPEDAAQDANARDAADRDLFRGLGPLAEKYGEGFAEFTKEKLKEIRQMVREDDSLATADAVMDSIKLPKSLNGVADADRYSILREAAEREIERNTPDYSKEAERITKVPLDPEHPLGDLEVKLLEFGSQFLTEGELKDYKRNLKNQDNAGDLIDTAIDAIKYGKRNKGAVEVLDAFRKDAQRQVDEARLRDEEKERQLDEQEEAERQAKEEAKEKKIEAKAAKKDEASDDRQGDKKPWEMTLVEFLAHPQNTKYGNPYRSGTAFTEAEKKKQLKQVEADLKKYGSAKLGSEPSGSIRIESGKVSKNSVNLIVRRPNGNDVVELQHVIRADAVKAGVDWAESELEGDSRSFLENRHKGEVRIAIKNGKPVPKEVLAEYPDLTAKMDAAENWLDSLSDNSREGAFASMRELSEIVERERSKARELGPVAGKVSVGSADFDHLLKAEVYDEFLRSLRKGYIPQDALENAKKTGREVVAKWNSTGVNSRAGMQNKGEMKRWDAAGDSIADEAMRRFQEGRKPKVELKQKPEVPGQMPYSRLTPAQGTPERAEFDKQWDEYQAAYQKLGDERAKHEQVRQTAGKGTKKLEKAREKVSELDSQLWNLQKDNEVLTHRRKATAEEDAIENAVDEGNRLGAINQAADHAYYGKLLTRDQKDKIANESWDKLQQVVKAEAESQGVPKEHLHSLVLDVAGLVRSFPSSKQNASIKFRVQQAKERFKATDVYNDALDFVQKLEHTEPDVKRGIKEQINRNKDNPDEITKIAQQAREDDLRRKKEAEKAEKILGDAEKEDIAKRTASLMDLPEVKLSYAKSIGTIHSAPDSKYVTDGKFIILASEASSKAKGEFAQRKGEREIKESMADGVFNDSAKKFSKPLDFLGATPVEVEEVRVGRKLEKRSVSSAFFRGEDGTIHSVNGIILRMLHDATKFDGVSVTESGYKQFDNPADRPLILTKGGKAIGVLWPFEASRQNKILPDAPSKSLAKTIGKKAPKRAKRAGGEAYAERTDAAGKPDSERREASAAGVLGPKVLKPLPMPELVGLARELLGHVPKVVAKLRGALGVFRHNGSRLVDILIRADAAKDPKMLSEVLAHEIGHLVDYLPDLTLARGNILGRLASLKNFIGEYMAGKEGGPGPLTADDEARLRKEAERLASKTSEVEIDEEIVRESPITPQDVLAIWNSLDTSKLNPDLLKYIKGLKDAEKKSIVLQAMKGIVRDDLKKYANKVVEKTGNKIKQTVTSDATKKDIGEKLNELIQEEIRKRELLGRRQIAKELKELSAWWRPWDEATATKEEKKYRNSSKELYADALSVFLNSPGDLEAKAPEFFRGLVSYMNRKPEFLKAYSDLQNLLNGDGEALAAQRTGNTMRMFDDAEAKMRYIANSIRDSATNIFKWFENFLGQGLYLTMYPVNKRIGKVMREGTEGQAKRAEQLKYMLDDLYRKDSPVAVMLGDINTSVLDPIREEGMSENDLGEYLLHKRVVNERGEMANPQGYTPAESNSQLDYLKKRLGDKRFASLEKAAKKFHDIVFEITKQAVEVGYYSLDNFKNKIEPNRDNYAAFAVTKYLEDYVPAAIKQQVGTFEDVGNPFTTTVMKLHSLLRQIDLNRGKGGVVRFLKENFPDEIESVPVNHQTKQATKPAPRGHENIYVFEDGKIAAYSVPTEVSKVFLTHDIGGLTQAAAVMGSAVYKVFHPVLVTFRPAFLAANPFKDIRRTLRTIPAYTNPKNQKPGQSQVTIRDLLRSYWENRGVAYRRAVGISDPLIREMYASRALDVPFVDPDTESADSTQINRMMVRHGIKQEAEPDRGVIVNAAKKLADLAEFVGVFQETLNKAAVYSEMKKHGYSTEEAAYVTKKLPGTPDYKSRGLYTAITNPIFMYSKVKWNGLFSELSLIQNPKTRASYALRLLPDIAATWTYRAALAGAFGPAVQEAFGYVSKYMLDNYDVIPLGFVDDEEDEDKKKLMFFSGPTDEVAQTARQIAGSMFDFVQELTAGGSKSGSPETAAGDAINSALTAVVPTTNPLLNIAHKWLEYSQGKNPKDFTNTDIVPPRSWAAGGIDSTKMMLLWTGEQFGVASDVAEFMGLPGRFGTRKEVSGPIFARIPGVSRLIRTSSYGLRENEKIDAGRDEQRRARFKIHEGSDFYKAVKEASLQKDKGESEDQKSLRLSLGDASEAINSLHRVLAVVKDESDAEAIHQMQVKISDEATKQYRDGNPDRVPMMALSKAASYWESKYEGDLNEARKKLNNLRADRMSQPSNSKSLTNDSYRNWKERKDSASRAIQIIEKELELNGNGQ
jgi:hypothetical protein